MAAAESAIYYPHHEGGKGSPMRIHDVAGKSAIYTIHIMNVLSSLLSAFMKKVVQFYGHHECGMLNFECA